jgi:hypothetical protein
MSAPAIAQVLALVAAFAVTPTDAAALSACRLLREHRLTVVSADNPHANLFRPARVKRKTRPRNGAESRTIVADHETSALIRLAEYRRQLGKFPSCPPSVERVNRLLALTASANPHEARNAAVLAVRLLKSTQLVIVPAAPVFDAASYAYAYRPRREYSDEELAQMKRDGDRLQRERDAYRATVDAEEKLPLFERAASFLNRINPTQRGALETAIFFIRGLGIVDDAQIVALLAKRFTAFSQPEIAWAVRANRRTA